MKSEFNRGEIAWALIHLFNMGGVEAFDISQGIYQFWNEAEFTEGEVRTMLDLKDVA